MAGTIKLDGTTFLSKSGSDFTLNNVTDIGTVTSGTFNGTFNGSIGNSATLNLATHFRPVDNFGHDGSDGDNTSQRTLTLSSNKTYIAFCNGYRTDGQYMYWRAMLFTVDGSGAVTTVLNDAPIDSNIPHLVSTGTNQVVLRSGHDSYRLTGVLFEMT